MTVFIAGNSHTGALQSGFQQADQPKSQFKIFPLGTAAHEVTPFSFIDNGQIAFRNQLYLDQLTKFTGKSYIDDTHVWGIMMGTHTTRLFQHGFWKTASPSIAPDSDLRPISMAVLDEIIEADQKYIKNFISQLKEIKVRAFVVSCPPFRRDGNVARSGVPLETIRAVDKRSRQRFTRWLAKQDVPFVAPPKNTFDSDGFLKEGFAKKLRENGQHDPHHANAKYGRLMFHKVRNFVTETYPDAVDTAAV